MYKASSFLAGVLLALMTLSYSIITHATGNFAGFIVIHIGALLGAVLLFLLTRSKFISIKGIPLIFLLGGVTGYLAVYFTNQSFLALGATITLMLSVFGQMVASTIIDHYGLLGMKKFPFDKKKLIGLGFMLCGVALIVFN